MRFVAAVDPEDPRSFQIDLELSAGAVHAAPFRLPVPLHRRQYQSDGVYERGDMVALDGSTWFCLVERATTAPPSEEWALVAQRGSRARPGRKAKKANAGTPACADCRV